MGQPAGLVGAALVEVQPIPFPSLPRHLDESGVKRKTSPGLEISAGWDGRPWSIPSKTGETPLSHRETRRVYDRIGAKQDTQAFYEDVATRELIRHGDFASATAVFEFGCGTGRSRTSSSRTCRARRIRFRRLARASRPRIPTARTRGGGLEHHRDEVPGLARFRGHCLPPESARRR
jgi:hypothetical protein